MRIRDERPADIEAVEALIAAAFREVPHSEQTEVFVVRALRQAGALQNSLVAEDGDGAIIGHVALSPVLIDGSAGDWSGLGPITVAPAQQRRGIGAQLMQAALARLRASGAGGCVLLGDPAYYARFGFRVVPGLVLPGVPPEYFQALCFGAPPPRGRVAYHAAFEARR